MEPKPSRSLRRRNDRPDPISTRRNVAKPGARFYISDAYNRVMQFSAIGTVLFWLSWWFLSGLVIGAMWWGASGTMTKPTGEPIDTFVQTLFQGCLTMADAEMPYVTGDGKAVVLLIAVSRKCETCRHPDLTMSHVFDCSSVYT